MWYYCLGKLGFITRNISFQNLSVTEIEGDIYWKKSWYTVDRKLALAITAIGFLWKAS